MMPMKSRKPLIAAVLAAALCLAAAGCGGSVPRLWIEQNNDFLDSVVEGVLWPAYAASGAGESAKANTRAAIDEHRALLADLEAPR